MVVNRAGLKSDQIGEAKEAFEELRKEAPFVKDCGEKGIELDNNQFGLLADYLYIRCNWEVERIESRLKHYEGWSQHEWYH